MGLAAASNQTRQATPAVTESPPLPWTRPAASNLPRLREPARGAAVECAPSDVASLRSRSRAHPRGGRADPRIIGVLTSLAYTTYQGYRERLKLDGRQRRHGDLAVGHGIQRRVQAASHRSRRGGQGRDGRSVGQCVPVRQPQTARPVSFARTRTSFPSTRTSIFTAKARTEPAGAAARAQPDDIIRANDGAFIGCSVTTMRIEGLSRSKVARARLSALIPIAATALLSLGQVQDLLIEQGHARLAQTASVRGVALRPLLASSRGARRFRACRHGCAWTTRSARRCSARSGSASSTHDAAPTAAWRHADRTGEAVRTRPHRPRRWPRPAAASIPASACDDVAIPAFACSETGS